MAEQVKNNSTGRVPMLVDEVLERGLAVVADDSPENAQVMAKMYAARRHRSGWRFIEPDTFFALTVALLSMCVMLVLIEVPSLDVTVLRWAKYVLSVPILIAGTWLAFSPIFSSDD